MKELYNSFEGTLVSLPPLIVDGSSGWRKVIMVKFLIPIYVYFYCFEIIVKNLSLNPTPSPCRQSSMSNSFDFHSHPQLSEFPLYYYGALWWVEIKRLFHLDDIIEAI